MYCSQAKDIVFRIVQQSTLNAQQKKKTKDERE